MQKAQNKALRERSLFIREALVFFSLVRQYWPLILSIGLFFGWLLSYPMQGPILGSAAAAEGANPLLPIVRFLAGIIVGQIAFGILGYYFQKALRWFALSGFLCLLCSVAALNTPMANSESLFALMGLASAPLIISWGAAFTRSVLPNQRGRVLVSAIALSNIILYIIIQASAVLSSDTLVLLTLPLLVLAPMALFYSYSQIAMLPPPTPEVPAKLFSFWPLLPFVFAVYIVGGLMYTIISTSWAGSGISAVYSVIPYIVLVFIAGSIADRRGRRVNAILGTGILGVGFMLYGISGGIMLPIVIHTLVVGGFAFMDTFTWTVPADLATGRRAPVFYGGVLGANVIAILIGILLGEQLGDSISEALVLTVSVAGLLLFASLAFLPKLAETLTRNIAPELSISEKITKVFQRAGLTPRELEVAGLVVTGASTEEMHEHLYISPDTLKSHLRNIYRKLGVKNRLEMTQRLLNSSFDEFS